MSGIVSGIEIKDNGFKIQSENFLKMIVSSKFFVENEGMKDLRLPIGVWNSTVLNILESKLEFRELEIYINSECNSIKTSVIKYNSYILVKNFFELFIHENTAILGRAIIITIRDNEWGVHTVKRAAELRELNYKTGTLPFQELTFTLSNGKSFEVQNILIPINEFLQSILEKERQLGDYEILVKKELCKKLIEAKKEEQIFLNTLSSEVREGTSINILALEGYLYEFVKWKSELFNGDFLEEAIKNAIEIGLEEQSEIKIEIFGNYNIQLYLDNHIFIDCLLSTEDVEVERKYSNNYLISFLPGVNETLNDWIWDNNVDLVCFSDFLSEFTNEFSRFMSLNTYIMKIINLIK